MSLDLNLGSTGKSQPLFFIIFSESSGGIATIISGSIENLPVKPPIALLVWMPE